MESHNKSTGRLWYGCLGWSRSLHTLHTASPFSTAGPQTSTEYLRAHTSNQVILTSPRPGSQTVSFWYGNLSLRTKHKEYASNLLLSSVILPEHLSSPVKIRVNSSSQQRLFILRWDTFLYDGLDLNVSNVDRGGLAKSCLSAGISSMPTRFLYSERSRWHTDTQMPFQQGREQQGKKSLLAFLPFCQDFCQLLALEPYRMEINQTYKANEDSVVRPESLPSLSSLTPEVSK